MTLTNGPEQKTRIAIVAITVLTFGGVVLNSVFAVSARATHQWTSMAPSTGGAYPVFLINKADRVVVRPTALRHRYGRFLVWPRAS